MNKLIVDIIKDRVLLVSCIFSISTSLISIFQLLISHLRNLSDEKIAQYKLNYDYKLECYGKLLALFLEECLTSEEMKTHINALAIAIPAAELLCEPKTYKSLQKLMEYYFKTPNANKTEDFHVLFQDVFRHMRNELAPNNTKLPKLPRPKLQTR